MRERNNVLKPDPVQSFFESPRTDRTSGQYTLQTAITILDVSGEYHNKCPPCNATGTLRASSLRSVHFMFDARIAQSTVWRVDFLIHTPFTNEQGLYRHFQRDRLLTYHA